MLTKLETKIVKLVYRVCCKSFTIPFTFKKSQFLIPAIPNKYFDLLVWFFLLSTTIYRITKTLVIIKTKEIDDIIVHGVTLFAGIANFICRLNIRIHRTEFLEVINQVMGINYTWGEYFIRFSKKIWLNRF